MVINLLILAACAVVTVLAVRMLLMRGIDTICTVFKLSSKARGQIIGYATSTPELVVIVSSALAGVFDAGFWNIASSNIINVVLFSSAITVYHQHTDLFSRRFIDELLFCVTSIAIPLALVKLDVGLTNPVAGGLVVLFIIYKAIDRALCVKDETNSDRIDRMTEASQPRGSVAGGLASLVAGIALIIVAGRFLGSSADALVNELGTPAWLIGWILGFITSVPEMASFFEIYRLEKSRGHLPLLNDTQSALDALVASNMSNLCIILPAGIVVFSLSG